MKVSELHVTISISHSQYLALLIINLPRVAFGRDPVVPSWCVSIKGPK